MRGHEEPIRQRSVRPSLPPRETSPFGSMTHEELVSALREIDGLVDVGIDPPNFHYRSQPFLHFHQDDQGLTYADVRFSGEFEPVWASSPMERQVLLARIEDHVEQVGQSRKSDRRNHRRRS